LAARSRLGRLALLLVSVLVTLGLAEVALRIAGVSYPNFYRPDPDLGWALTPGASGWWKKEGRAFVRINPDGERDIRHPLEKPPGTLRIAILGDSCTEALQVPVEETFWARLPRELASCPALAGHPGKSVETLNFGVSGYGTAQELLTLRTRVFKYHPDLVLLAFYTGNDVRNNYRPLEQDPLRPYFVLQGGRLVLDDSFRTSSGYRARQTFAARLLYAAFNHSALLQVGKMAKSAGDGLVGAYKAKRVTTQAIEELGLDNAVYSPPGNADWQAAWAVTEAMLREMGEEVRAHGARFAVVTLTDGIQVHPDVKKRQAFARQLGIADLFYPDERIKKTAEAAGIPVLNLAPPLADYAARTGQFLHGFPNTRPGEGHWNARGHREAARVLGRWLCGMFALRAAPRARGGRQDIHYFRTRCCRALRRACRAGSGRCWCGRRRCRSRRACT
jgi:lysophospholipase L1-like esterase